MRPGFDPWVGKIPWKRKWQPSPVFLPGQRNLVGYSPWCRKESDMNEQLSTPPGTRGLSTRKWKNTLSSQVHIKKSPGQTKYLVGKSKASGNVLKLKSYQASFPTTML